jgi:hypothetical protein
MWTLILVNASDDIKKFLHAYSPSDQPVGNYAALNQDCSAIHHNGLPGAESFLHQKQIGLRYVMSLTDSANWETLAHALIQVLAFCRSHALPEVCPNDSGRYRVNPDWRELDR